MPGELPNCHESLCRSAIIDKCIVFFLSSLCALPACCQVMVTHTTHSPKTRRRSSVK